MRKILITGGSGQIGVELTRQAWPADVQIQAPSRQELDLGNADSIYGAITAQNWSCVINSAAYTAVDAAENDVGNAFQANCQGPAWLAEAANNAGIPFIHISTDYVFSGSAAEPYAENDAVSPIGVYGASKAAGELAVKSAHSRSVIIRTAWVLSPHRSNFLTTILRKASERQPLRVVADQRGCPSSAHDVADAIRRVAIRHMDDSMASTGTYHFVNSGDATWFELAWEILRLSAVLGGPSAEVVPITAADFPTQARRPANSRLSTHRIAQDFGIVPRGWQAAVADIMDEMSRAGTLKELAR